MTFPVYLSFAGAVLSFALAFFIFLQDRHSSLHFIFAVGMIVLSSMEFFAGMRLRSESFVPFFYWENLEVLSQGFLPGIWLLFSLSYGRSNYKELLVKWKWPALGSFIFPFFLHPFFNPYFFKSPFVAEGSTILILPLGSAGYVYYLISLMISVMILINLEGTLRSSVGIKRWQIKFMILGVGSLFVVLIYTISQTLLFRSINLSLRPLTTYAVIVADIFIVLSIIRKRFLGVDVYVSREFLYNSVTIIGVGIYLLVIGVLAKLISYFGGNQVLSLAVLFVFLAMVFLGVILMSDQVRVEVKRFLSKNFYQSRYDYRKQWADFTGRTSSMVNGKDLCSAITKLVSDIYGVPSVSIWIMDEPQDQMSLGGSTVFSEVDKSDSKKIQEGFDILIPLMRHQRLPVDFDRPNLPEMVDLKKNNKEFFDTAVIRYSVSLISGQRFLGIMTLSDRVTRESFSLEDVDLLKVIADQTAGSLLNIKLSQNLLKAKELEAFQSLSAFFIHDLKNLASTLSLTLKNLPLHYGDPEFREDAFKVISKSVEKMNGMCGRLTLLTNKMELNKIQTDLNELINQTLAETQGSLKCSIVKNLQLIPSLMLDPDQFQKVLTNLILNANEAVSGQDGKIQIKTEPFEKGKVCLSISDNGCGISQEFLSKSLFHPFQTTKSQGLGIGLYHSKLIVEEHQGKIEVESQKGVGTTFRVILPNISETISP
ncbi:MAG: XrtA/PEP-CTERM system histidine kinase PrsK [Nitrospiria bacterium]